MTDHKDHEKEEELNELFQGPTSKQSFGDVIKRAKRRTLFRNVLVSLFVIVFLFIVLGFSWLALMRVNEEKAIRDLERFSTITRANVEQSGVQMAGNGLFKGTLYFNRYKVIEGVPMKWSDDVATYSLFGGVSKLLGDHSPISETDPQDGLMRYYDRETTERMMEFYHPSIEYSQYRNDFNRLNNIPNESLLEIGLSFDSAYTPEEVRELIPNNVSLKWYWADTYPSDVGEENVGNLDFPPGPELSTQIYGFDHVTDDPAASEQLFIYNIKLGLEDEGKYVNEYQRIATNLSDTQTLSEENVRVLGAVITGKAEEIKKLDNLEFIRASVLGVTVNPNQ
jgi:hypothetical protein